MLPAIFFSHVTKPAGPPGTSSSHFLCLVLSLTSLCLFLLTSSAYFSPSPPPSLVWTTHPEPCQISPLCSDSSWPPNSWPVPTGAVKQDPSLASKQTLLTDFPAMRLQCAAPLVFRPCSSSSARLKCHESQLLVTTPSVTLLIWLTSIQNNIG